MTDDGSTRVPGEDDALAKGFRHAAYGCWLTSVRASGANVSARDIRLLAAAAAGVVDEIRALCAAVGVPVDVSVLHQAMSALATAKADADAAADEAMACWHRARAGMTAARKEPSPEAFRAATQEHHVACDAMERAQGDEDRANQAATTISEAVTAILSATSFDATFQPSADQLHARAVALVARETEHREPSGDRAGTD